MDGAQQDAISRIVVFEDSREVHVDPHNGGRGDELC
jgi:hypothetical protein